MGWGGFWATQGHSLLDHRTPQGEVALSQKRAYQQDHWASCACGLQKVPECLTSRPSYMPQGRSLYSEPVTRWALRPALGQRSLT